MILFQRRWPHFSQFFNKFRHFFCKLRSFCRGYPFGMQTVFLDSTEGKQLLEKLNPLICRVITVQVMAFTQISPAHKNTIHSLLKSKKDMMRRHTCRTHYPHSPDIRGVLQPTDPSQVSSSVCSPCAQEAYNFWFVIGIVHGVSFISNVSMLKVENPERPSIRFFQF